MNKKILIKNIKNIKHLEFTIPSKGVKLLTGINGSGKTTLLTCLARIGKPTAFKKGFITYGSRKVDSFSNASVSYIVDDQEVAFSKKEKYWASQKGKKHVLDLFGFKSVVFITAGGERLEPTGKELNDKRPEDFDEELAKTIFEILENNKFNNLKALKVDRGRGKKILLIKDYIKFKTNKTKRFVRYYSEKNFSLGEIGIIRLVQALQDCPKDSLVLIDEVEMSLHPRMQINLLRYLKQIATSRNLTVIVSTHSVTMIKYTGKRDILFLNDPSGNGQVECLNPCYPAVLKHQFRSPYP